MLITVIMTVIYSVTAVVTGHASAVATRKGKGATLLHGWFTGRVFLACQVIRSQTHPIGATTHPLEIRHWEAEVAAVSIRMCGSITVVRTWKSNTRGEWVMSTSTGLIIGWVCEGKQMEKEQCSDPTLQSSFFLEVNMPNIIFSLNIEKVLKMCFSQQYF